MDLKAIIYNLKEYFKRRRIIKEQWTHGFRYRYHKANQGLKKPGIKY